MRESASLEGKKEEELIEIYKKETIMVVLHPHLVCEIIYF
jgi:hypothetical protein